MSTDRTIEQIKIRRSTPNDLPVILEMIKGLAEYEKLADEVSATEKNLKRFIFGDEKFVDVWIAEINGKAAGHVIYFKNFSTFLSKPGLYIEELFVKPEFRGKGIGKMLFKKIISLASEKNFGRVEWAVLDWNEQAVDFYKEFGSQAMSDWTVFRITEEEFGKLPG